MAKKRTSRTDTPKTTAQQLGSLVKSARDIMRKDRGLNGDLDRLPMLTWVMFLKFLDDLEQSEEVESKLAGKKYRSAIEAPYRWRDWAAKKDGVTGEELIRFINNDEAVRPDGNRGPGLFACLRSLQGRNGDGRRDVIANVFRGVTNRMVSGYLLRDVINLVDGIHFSSAEEMHTLGHLYESMLREMRDAAGDSGEFYTPRPVVRFMVEALDPQLGETILDPACGTAGFLVESYTHLEKQCKTVEHLKVLQERSIFGGEAKPLPYMLAQMNLLLHGLRSPRVAYGNSLAVKLTEIGHKNRVDVILTNPPFGGEEEAGIRGNFPADKQTSETALLFLQLIMRKLKRPGPGSEKGGRAGVVVPNGALFGDGVCARIKRELLIEFNLHTIVRLPNGVFAPYTSIPTNLLFFDCSGPTKTIWYYEQPLPEGRKNYSKTKPIQYEEFADCLKWWGRRKENGRAWKVKASDVVRLDDDGNLVSVNLDIKNPNAAEALEHKPPEELVESILVKERRIVEIMGEIKAILRKGVRA
ncbi:MAG: class I SAM-dependent DNA methyltransferase [Planctomycetia bacterium]|nr:class I SAM-dependent DNA methyltransferase [Planctomycetia bacterium]